MALTTPHESLGWSRWRRSWWYHAVYDAQTWRGSLVSSVLFPFLILASMGVGVGHLVTAHSGLVDGQTYLHFLAPSLLATTAMQLSESQSMWPVLAAVKWLRTYHAAATTPLKPEDIYLGKVTWVTSRSLATSVIYTGVIALFGGVESWWGLTLPLIGALVTAAFAAPLVAYAASVRSDASFVSIYRFAFIPMFLFSATFYPLSAYPSSLRPFIQLVPLYHGVALARAAAYGHGNLAALVTHAAVLVAMAGLGVAWGRHALRRRLVD